MAKITKEAALLYHSEGKRGKIEVIPTKPHSTQTGLALAYSPGVAEPCLEIEKNPQAAYDYTAKGNLVAVISNGTAIIWAAGLLNALEVAGKKIEKVKIAVNGAGASASSCTKLYMALGAKKENTERRAREEATYEEALDQMFERNYFGMMMVETGEADAFITGLYTKYTNTIKVAKEVIGIRPGYNYFGTLHILNSKKGTYFLADTLINRHPGTDALIDIAKLTDETVRFLNHIPVMAMISYSNFGSDAEGSPLKVHQAVAYMQENYPDLAIDGEMQVNFAFDKELRDAKYPFSRLYGKDVNTLVFPNLSSANSGYKMIQAMNKHVELVGPIQMGLNKPIHFTDIESPVREIVNITAAAAIDAIVAKKKKE